jgi:hypothetical protein
MKKGLINACNLMANGYQDHHTLVRINISSELSEKHLVTMAMSRRTRSNAWELISKQSEKDQRTAGHSGKRVNKLLLERNLTILTSRKTNSPG